MPELPDVETVARMLRRTVLGRRIRRVQVITPSTIRSPAATLFARRLRGRIVRRVGRRGKYLLVELDRGLTLLIHLRMTGDFAFVRRTVRVHPHTRVVFSFGAHELRFVDQRRFGHMDLVPTVDLPAFEPLRRVGVEPLDRTFTQDLLHTLLHHRRGALKGFLLRQDLIAGLGNIYADEVLWQARLHPRRQVNTLRPADAHRLHNTIRSVLKNAVRSLSRYGRPVGTLLDVREAGGLCPRDGHPLTIAPIAGRTTYFCSACQK